MAGQLAGKAAIVTGGASGIGRATVATFLEEGAAVAILDRDRAGAEEALAALGGEGRRLLVLPVDLRNTASLEPVFAEAVAQLGQADILVNCAGVFSDVDLFDITEDHWDMVMDINLKAPVFLTRAMARHLRGRGAGGKIVNLSSGHGFRAGLPVAYSCSKAAIAMLTKVSAQTLGRDGVNVNTVAPGATDTPLIAEFRDAVAAQIAQGGPLGNMMNRMATPEDVAAAILFLCLPASDSVTAHTLHTGAGSVYWS